MTTRPNVLLVVLEGARSDHFSSYGYARATTPFLDRTAAEGVRFARTFSVAPTTLAAHAALFTGLYPSTSGVHAERPRLPNGLPLLAELLAAQGYRTGAFCPSNEITPEAGFGRGFETFYTQRYQNRLADRAVSYGRRAGDRLLNRVDAGARRTNEALREWIGGDERPFFAFVHYDETRLPLTVTPAPEFVEAAAAARLRGLVQDAEAQTAGQLAMAPEDWAAINGLFDSALRYVDARVAEIHEMLAARGAWDRTLLVVTADHGQCFGEQNLLGNAVGLADPLLRVPLLLRAPTLVPRGFVVDEIAQTVDIAPTILRTLGIHVPPTWQGRPLLQGHDATPGPAFAVAERFRPDLAALRRRFPDVDCAARDVRMKAIRTRNEKFVWRSDERNELYDLDTDPREIDNRLAHDVARADSLRRQLFDWFAMAHRAAAEGADAPFADAARA